MAHTIPHKAVRFLDPQTGHVDERWYGFLARLESSVGAVISDSSIEGDVSGLGQQLTGAQDLALLAQHLRDPRPGPAIAAELLMPGPQKVLELSEVLAQEPIQRQWSTFSFIQDTAANRTNYPAANYNPGYYVETDTFIVLRSDGTAWIEVIAPALVKFLGATSSFPALKRSSAILQVRLADDSAYTALEVLDEAYGSGWNGVVQVPTKNAVYDKIESLNLASGVYTPTLTNVANLGASTAYECQYLRVGSMVTVSGKVDVDPTLAATLTQLGITLPIASNIGALEDVAGVAFSSVIAGQGAGILGDAANNRAEMDWTSTDVTNQPMYFTFSYAVI